MVNMYGEGRNLRYFVGLGLVIVLLFVVIFMIIRGGGDEENKVAESEREFTSYVDDSDVTISMTTVGPIVAAQEHNELQINITNSNASIDVMQGYDGNVISSQSYPISTAAFGEFLHALDKADFTKGDTSDDLKDDRGFCPTGQRYIFEVRDGSRSVQRFWATSCRTVKTYHGNLALTRQLFEDQIPDYSGLTSDTNL